MKNDCQRDFPPDIAYFIFFLISIFFGQVNRQSILKHQELIKNLRVNLTSSPGRVLLSPSKWEDQGARKILMKIVGIS